MSGAELRAYARRMVRPAPEPEFTVDGWRLKLTGICAAGASVSPEVFAAARARTSAVLPRPAVDASATAAADGAPGVSVARTGVGFVVVHPSREGVFSLTGWWIDETMLAMDVAFAAWEADGETVEASAFAGLPESRVLACTWELAVIAFERDAWVELVLDNPAGPDVEAWFSRRMHADV
ncbi:MAG: hypothetical protein AB8G96_04445 [Phycisphaerales bacterium]